MRRAACSATRGGLRWPSLQCVLAPVEQCSRGMALALPLLLFIDMGTVDWILGTVVAGSEFRTHEFLGPQRVHPRTRADNDLDWWPAARDSAGTGLGARLLGVREAAGKLVASNGASATSIGSGVTVSSSRLAAVSAEAVEGSTRGRSALFEVKITNLARAQVNAGQALASSEANAIQAGINTFTVKVRTGPAKTVSFTNDSTDTNEEALRSLAAAINAANAGATASVVKDGEAGTVQLVLTADSTGLAHAFEIADVSGNVADLTGLGSATTEPENAEFVVNGVAQTSGSNTVLIDQGRVRLSLKAETGPAGHPEEPGAVVSVEPDSLSKAVLDLAISINGLRDFLTADGSAHALRTRDTFDELLTGKDAALETMGIIIGQTGQIDVDGDRLERAIAGDRKTVDAVLRAEGGLGAKFSAAADGALGGARLRARLDALIACDAPLLGSALVGPARGSLRGVLVDMFG